MLRNRLAAVVLGLAGTLLIPGDASRAEREEPVEVSLVQLIATPKEYHGKLVRCIGFVRLEFEGNAIYLHKDDHDHRISRNGLWLDVNDEIEKDRQKFNGRYVLVEGTLDAMHHGHFGMWSGEIADIRRFQRWR